MDALLAQLEREGLLRPDAGPGLEANSVAEVLSPPHLRVLALCDQGALEGGLSVALDVRPDELIGALCELVGGGARRLRVLDVREGPPLELRIRHGELEERWEVEDLPALVHNLNDLLRADPAARAVAVLGEWQDGLQLWCLPKQGLGRLLRQDFLIPLNSAELEGIVDAGGRS